MKVKYTKTYIMGGHKVNYIPRLILCIIYITLRYDMQLHVLVKQIV